MVEVSRGLAKGRNDKSLSAIGRYWGIIKNGMFLFGIRNRLAKIGLDITPYYWVQEETEPCTMPMIKDDSSKYVVRYISKEEFSAVSHVKSGQEYDNMMASIDNGQFVVGLETNGKIAAYTFVEPNDFEFNGRKFELGPQEAYLLNMWTFHEFRGRNLAPFLRYQTYQLLREKGILVKYSITNFFNKSSIKFKNKLNAKHLYLYLSIVVFKRYKWNFTLRKF